MALLSAIVFSNSWPSSFCGQLGILQVQRIQPTEHYRTRLGCYGVRRLIFAGFARALTISPISTSPGVWSAPLDCNTKATAPPDMCGKSGQRSNCSAPLSAPSTRSTPQTTTFRARPRAMRSCGKHQADHCASRAAHERITLAKTFVCGNLAQAFFQGWSWISGRHLSIQEFSKRYRASNRQSMLYLWRRYALTTCLALNEADRRRYLRGLEDKRPLRQPRGAWAESPERRCRAIPRRPARLARLRISRLVPREFVRRARI